MPSTSSPPVAPTSGSYANSMLLAVLCVPMFLVLLDVMAMNVAMPSLGRAFGVPTGEWAYVVDAYTIPLAVGLVPAGFVVDRLGPRRMLIGGLVVFTFASLLGALAWAWPVVLFARAAQGVAAAVMLPAGLAALTLTWREPAARARVLGMWSGVSAVATALGPAAGGLLVGAASWRMVFVINVPLGLLAMVGTLRFLPNLPAAPERGAPGRKLPLVASVVVAGMMTSGANGTLQVITVHLQSGLALGPGSAGAILLLATAPFAILGPVSGRLVTRFGRRPIAAGGFLFGASGLATLSLADDAAVASLIPALLGIGVGLGLMTSAIVGETMAAWPARPARQGLAGGLNNALRQVGTSGGVAAGGAIAGQQTGAQLLSNTGIAAASWWAIAAVIVGVCFARRGSE